jgi:hypothetical protein
LKIQHIYLLNILSDNNSIKNNASQIPKNLCGACDCCGTYLYEGDVIIYNIEYCDTLFGLQFCNINCKDKNMITYPLLKNLKYEQEILRYTISFDKFKKIFTFIIKHPWSVFYNSNQMIIYIE